MMVGESSIVSHSELTHHRQRLPSISDSLRQNVYYCSMCIVLHVETENRALPLGHERSQAAAYCKRSDWLLWSFWHVL